MAEELKNAEEALPFGEMLLPDMVEAEAPKKKARRPKKQREKYITVKVVRERRGNALLEWDDDLGHVQRCFLPLELVDAAGVGQMVSVKESVLVKGAPFGDDLTPHLQVETPTPEVLQNELRKRGIWGRGDVMRHPNTVRSVLQYVYRLDVVAIQNRVRAAIERDKRR